VGEWQPTEDTKALSKRARLRRELVYPLYFQYTDRCRWFIAVELVTTGFFSVARAISEGGGCEYGTPLLAAAALGYFVAVLCMRPHAVPLDTGLTRVIAGLQLLMAIIAVWTSYLGGDVGETLGGVIDTLIMVTALSMLLMAALDAFLFCGGYKSRALSLHGGSNATAAAEAAVVANVMDMLEDPLLERGAGAGFDDERVSEILLPGSPGMSVTEHPTANNAIDDDDDEEDPLAGLDDDEPFNPYGGWRDPDRITVHDANAERRAELMALLSGKSLGGPSLLSGAGAETPPPARPPPPVDDFDDL